jgi:hypothetical protein
MSGVAANGEQKQRQVLAFEHQLLRQLTTDVHSRSMLHPSTMYGLFNPFWWGHVDEDWVHRFARYTRLQPRRVVNVDPPRLPYTAVKFYFNDSFPDTDANRAFVRRTLQELAARGPVVSLATGLQLDDHTSDVGGAAGVRTLPPDMHPRGEPVDADGGCRRCLGVRRHLRRLLVSGAVSRCQGDGLLHGTSPLLAAAPPDGALRAAKNRRGWTAGCATHLRVEFVREDS